MKTIYWINRSTALPLHSKITEYTQTACNAIPRMFVSSTFHCFLSKQKGETQSYCLHQSSFTGSKPLKFDELECYIGVILVNELCVLKIRKM